MHSMFYASIRSMHACSKRSKDGQSVPAWLETYGYALGPLNIPTSSGFCCKMCSTLLPRPGQEQSASQCAKARRRARCAFRASVK